MPRFVYKAVSPDGDVIEGALEAGSQQAVVERLRAQGHIPIRADETGAQGPRRFSLGLPTRKRRLARRDVVLVTRELATLLHAGLPLDRAFSIMIDLAPASASRDLLESVRDRVRGGVTLADAMAAHPEAFPNFYVGMVRAGEAGGTLETVLGRLADTLERAQRLRENVRSALRYPMLVVVMAVISLAVLMTAVIPQFRPLFEDSGAALPTATLVVIGASDFIQAYWWLLALALLLLAVGVRRHNRTAAGRMRADRWLARAPIFGELVTKVEVARFSRTLGTLLDNGVSMLNALAMTVETLDNRAIAAAVARTQGRLAKGEGLAGPLAESGFFPGLALQLIQVGEETGQLDNMLLRIADIYDEEVQRTIQRMLSLLVPLITAALGILIAGIIGAMMAAILSAYDLPI